MRSLSDREHCCLAQFSLFLIPLSLPRMKWNLLQWLAGNGLTVYTTSMYGCVSDSIYMLHFGLTNILLLARNTVYLNFHTVLDVFGFVWVGRKRDQRSFEVNRGQQLKSLWNQTTPKIKLWWTLSSSVCTADQLYICSKCMCFLQRSNSFWGQQRS